MNMTKTGECYSEVSVGKSPGIYRKDQELREKLRLLQMELCPHSPP